MVLKMDSNTEQGVAAMQTSIDSKQQFDAIVSHLSHRAKETLEMWRRAYHERAASTDEMNVESTHVALYFWSKMYDVVARELAEAGLITSIRWSGPWRLTERAEKYLLQA
jgi:aminoglycoside N3'-acetyltransferase